MTVGGDRLDYAVNTATEVASLETTKIHANSTISTPGSRQAFVDIGKFYTNSRLREPEFMKVHISYIPQEFIDEYNLMIYDNEDVFVYVEIIGAVYGLKQAGKITNDDLIEYLKEFGYYPSRKTPGLWLHTTRKISFTLVVDDLGVNYVDKADAGHLFSAIEAKYPLKIDWEANTYLGINFEWHYNEGYFILSMKRYIEKALKEYLWRKPAKPVHSPSKYTRPTYGQKVQYSNVDISTEMNDKQKRQIHKITGKFLYNAISVYSILLHALNELNIASSKATEQT